MGREDGLVIKVGTPVGGGGAGVDAEPLRQRGRELAALDIEAEARAYEDQFGTTGAGGAAAAVLWRAAQIARGI